uniref:Uncharacterized protein n=1 Tax=Lynx canadensis TaxID=61383 RepID=A0A667HHK5_LYNCA
MEPGMTKSEPCSFWGSVSPHGNHSACLEMAVAFGRREMHTLAKEVGLAQLRFLLHGANPLRCVIRNIPPPTPAHSQIPPARSHILF